MFLLLFKPWLFTFQFPFVWTPYFYFSPFTSVHFFALLVEYIFYSFVSIFFNMALDFTCLSSFSSYFHQFSYYVISALLMAVNTGQSHERWRKYFGQQQYDSVERFWECQELNMWLTTMFWRYKKDRSE